MSDLERKAWLALAATPKLSNRAIWRLAEEAGGPLQAAAKWARPDAREFPAEVLTPGDPDYPHLLLRLEDPPICLYWKGRPWPGSHKPRVAIVGSRRATTYGLRVAHRLARRLANSGVDIVSGLALGIDASAHWGALEASGGHPIGVLGCGIDQIYPRTNERLFDRMKSRGTLFSEYPGMTAAAPFRFPIRNRIIAALSDIVVVVEASKKSGSFHTADAALSLGKVVMAVPGALGSPNRVGVHALLRDGAHLVTCAEDVLELLEIKKARPQPTPPSGPAGEILRVLAGHGTSFETLQRHSDMSTGELTRIVSQLELEGWLVRTPAGYLFSCEPDL